MNTALVISQSPGSKDVVRSDMVAAKVLQNAIKEGRGEEVLAPRVQDPSAQGLAGTQSQRLDAVDKKPEAGAARKDPSATGIVGSGNPQIREKIGDMTRTLTGLTEVFEAMSNYQSIIMESDSATAIAFAGNVLENAARVAETGVEPSDVVETKEAQAAAEINGLKETEPDGNASRGEGVRHVLGDEGADTYHLEVGRAELSLKEARVDDVVDLASGSHLKFAVSDPSMMETGAVSAVWEGDNLALDFDNGDRLEINNAVNAGSISMQSGGVVLTLMPPKSQADLGILDITV